MSNIEILDQLYQGHYCSNCGKKLFCDKNPEHTTCIEWEAENSMISDMLKVVRKAYPITIANEIVSVEPMKKSDDIFYIKLNEEKNETT